MEGKAKLTTFINRGYDDQITTNTDPAKFPLKTDRILFVTQCLNPHKLRLMSNVIELLLSSQKGGFLAHVC